MIINLLRRIFGRKSKTQSRPLFGLAEDIDGDRSTVIANAIERVCKKGATDVFLSASECAKLTSDGFEVRPLPGGQLPADVPNRYECVVLAMSEADVRRHENLR